MCKNLIYGLLAAGMLLATSCIYEDIDTPQSADEAKVSFALGLEGSIGTRAISDGAGVDKLVYAVYKIGEQGVYQEVIASAVENVENFVENGVNLSVPLAKGQSYCAAFWAQRGSCSAYVTDDLTNVQVKYGKATNNNEARDAFCARTEVFDAEDGQIIDVTLKRPFAQVNVGVTKEDWDNAVASGYVVAKSSAVITKAATSINLLTGEVGPEEEDVVVEYLPANIPSETLSVDTDGDGEKEPFVWLSMSYILVADRSGVEPFGAQSTTESMSFTFTPEAGTAIVLADGLSSVPVQRNWRTNIVGRILTGETAFNITVDPTYDNDYKHKPVINVSNSEELYAAFVECGSVKLLSDIVIDKRVELKEGDEVYLDMNGKTITFNNPDPSNLAYCFVTRKGSTFTLDGNGTVQLTDPATCLIFPGGDVIIENGTFVREVPEGTSADYVAALFMGAKVDPWGSQSVVINGGYFDGGYYNPNADLSKFVETEDDKAKRGKSGDKNLTRTALKENIQLLLNLSYNLFKVYGGTFVGANPAWGDEGCMLPTTPQYLRPWSYYQGPLIEGQEFHEDGIVLPEGYAITEGTTEDGVPTYTVTYTK